MAMVGKGSGRHSGVERRRGSRRNGSERRDEVRWEPKKDGRRHGHGRRAGDGPVRPRD